MPERPDPFVDRLVEQAGAPDGSGRELRDELVAHFEDATAAHGSLDAARRAFGPDVEISSALRRVYAGAYDDARETSASGSDRPRSVRRAAFGGAAGMIRDLRFGVRMLLRQPGFTALAIACLTLAVGSNAAVFTWIEGLLLRPYPLVAHQERLFAVAGTTLGSSELSDVSWPDWLDLARGSRLAEAFIAEKITGTTLTVGDRAQRVPGSMVSANYFDAIGVHPVLGRGFEAGEDVGRNAHPVVVISYEAWRDRFQRDPAIIGRAVVLNGLAHTIVGVAPEGFYGTFVGYAFQFWVPASMQPQFSAGVYRLEDRGARWIEGYVRLKPGVTMAQAQAELSATASRLQATYPATNKGRGIELFPLWQTPFNNAGALLPTLGIALAVVMAVLLIACANVANLLLVRAFARQREMTIRLSVGATRGRLVRQLLAEGLILSTIGGVGGLVVGQLLRNALGLLVLPHGGIPLRLPGELDWRVASISVAIAFGSTLVFALVPALLTSRIDLAGAIRSGATSVVGARSRAWVRGTLILVQMSLSFVLLTGSGLLIKSLYEVRRTSPGFATQHVLTTFIDLYTAGYDATRAAVFHDELIERVQAVPGVASAGLARATPFAFSTYPSAVIGVDGLDTQPGAPPTADYNAISPGYLGTMDIAVAEGRDFTRSDDVTGAPVVIVDETMADTYWRGSDPVGRRLRVNGRWATIVGVARNARYRNLLEAVRPFFYVPLRQDAATVVALFVRTSASPTAVTTGLVAATHALDVGVSPGEVISMQEQVDRTTAPQRIAVTMLVVFGGIALVLAAVGLYGVIAAVVAQSASELALRVALGAARSDLMAHVLWQGLTLAVGGVAIGAATALLSTRLLGYLLYRVGPRDPLAFGGAAVVVSVAAFLATTAPAWRAARTNPVQILRG